MTSPPDVLTPLRAASLRKLAGASRGTVRSGAISSAFFTRLFNPGACIIAFASIGDTAASDSQRSTIPNA